MNCLFYRRRKRGLTLAEIIVAMGILAIWSVPIIFTSQKALQSSMQTEELQRSYEHAQGLAERCIALAASSEVDNWGLFDQDTDGDGDIEDGTAVYHWAYKYDFTRGTPADDATEPDERPLSMDRSHKRRGGQI